MRLLDDAAASFDDPVGLLRACHERILEHCETLERLAEHLARVGVDSEARLAATRIRRCFHMAGPAHHADEENQLFPWLLARPDFPSMLRAVVRNLTDQHRQLEVAWRVLDADLLAVENGEQPEALHLEPFISMNRAHVALENGEIFPVAEKLLEEGVARRLGAAMAKRRVEGS